MEGGWRWGLLLLLLDVQRTRCDRSIHGVLEIQHVSNFYDVGAVDSPRVRCDFLINEEVVLRVELAFLGSIGDVERG